MPDQMTPAQARVIDPILSSVVRGFKHSGNILSEALFPYVSVPKRGGTRIEFGKEDFKAVTTIRTPGSRVGEVQFGHSGKTYALVDHALAAKVPQEHVQETAGTPAADQMGRAANSVMRILLLNLERDQAALATDAAKYAAGNKATLTGTDQWSAAAADIAQQVADWKAAVRGKIGMDPNTMVLPYKARNALRHNTQFQEAVKYTRGGFPTIEDIARFLEIERVFEAKAVTNPGDDTFSDVWGDFGWLGYVEASPSDMGMPSFGYTYRLNGHPLASEMWFDRDVKSWKSDVEFTRSPEIVGADAGYLVTDLVG